MGDQFIVWSLKAAALYVAILFIKEGATELGAGLWWRIFTSLKEDQIIMVNFEWARIEYIGFFKTKLNVYYWIDEKDMDNDPAGGMIRKIANAELRRMDIRKPLSLMDLPKGLRKLSKGYLPTTKE